MNDDEALATATAELAKAGLLSDTDAAAIAALVFAEFGSRAPEVLDTLTA